MGRHDEDDFFFVLSDKDTKKRWHEDHRTTYGSFALEPKTNKKRGQFVVQQKDGSIKKAQHVTRILGDSLVVTYTAEDGFGLGFIDSSSQKNKSARRRQKKAQAQRNRERKVKAGCGGYNTNGKECRAIDKENVVQNTQQTAQKACCAA
jgi:hypothetical protein